MSKTPLTLKCSTLDSYALSRLRKKNWSFRIVLLRVAKKHTRFILNVHILITGCCPGTNENQILSEIISNNNNNNDDNDNDNSNGNGDGNDDDNDNDNDSDNDNDYLYSVHLVLL